MNDTSFEAGGRRMVATGLMALALTLGQAGANEPGYDDLARSDGADTPVAELTATRGWRASRHLSRRHKTLTVLDVTYEIIAGTEEACGTTHGQGAFEFAKDGLGLTGGGMVSGHRGAPQSMMSADWFGRVTQAGMLKKSMWWLNASLGGDEIWGLKTSDFAENNDGHRLGYFTNTSAAEAFIKEAYASVDRKTRSKYGLYCHIAAYLEDSEWQVCPIILRDDEQERAKILVPYKLVKCKVRPVGKQTAQKDFDACAIYVMDLDMEMDGHDRADSFKLVYFPDKGNEFALEKTYYDALEKAYPNGSYQKGHVLKAGQLCSVW